MGDLHVYGPASVSVVVKFGSTAFVRACVQLGSLFSVDGEGQIGGSFSIFDIGSIGTTLSVRAFRRCSSWVYVFDDLLMSGVHSAKRFVSFADVLSVREFSD